MATASCVPNILPENYRVLQDRVYEHTGIVLGTDKEYLLNLRLGGLLCDLGLGSINDLCRLMLQDRTSQISQRVAEAMTTNETYFFREPAHYELIQKVLLPRLAGERKKSRSLRFWSAACSSGQEAYSLAMLLLQENFADWDIKILGSDYSATVVERARKGLYRQVEVNRGVPANQLVRHFERSGLEWQISAEVREMCTFESRDLRQPMRSLGPFEMVFCRNVMIYFDTETKAAILRNLHGTLVRGGWLLLGGAEASLDSPEYFDKQRIDGVTVYVAR